MIVFFFFTAKSGHPVLVGDGVSAVCSPVLEEFPAPPPFSPPAAPAAAPAPAASAAPAAGEQICAPMPGNILAVNVTAGQAVKKGDVLMVLEAMKMENEIMCPRDGVVASVNTSKGASVESGTLLCVLQ